MSNSLNEHIKLWASALMLLRNTVLIFGIIGPLAAWAYNQAVRRAAQFRP